MDNFEGALKDEMSGIKKRKRIVRLSRFNLRDGIVSDTDEIKDYVPGKGIVHIQDIHAKILDCGHSAGLGLGHVADCGHTVCTLCVEKFILECQNPDCFRRLCTVERCPSCARFVDGVYSCRGHYFWAIIGSFFSSLFLGRRRFDERLERVGEVYSARRMQIRGKNGQRTDKKSSA